MSKLAMIVLNRIWTAAANAEAAGAVTLCFATFAWLVRGATASGAIAGAGVCFALILGAGWGAFAALCTVFVLTWIATRIGYARKLKLGTAESRRGRDALQVLANVAVAAACAVMLRFAHNADYAAATAAALAEAAGDTVESEIGQALGSTPRLITNWQRVPAGTDGAITTAGTLAGVLAVVTVSAVCFATGVIPGRAAFICAGSAILATLLDSLLGATLERNRRLGNNSVNFLSTLFAAALAFAMS
ncbi:MAG TPA: DUF92 domain-containing protein [Terriglobales bacterium]